MFEVAQHVPVAVYSAMCFIGAIGAILPPVSYKKVGALRFFRIGRFGGSFYLAKKSVKAVG